MKRMFALVFPLTVALAASLGCASANAAQTTPDKTDGVNGAVVAQAAKTNHGLTRREVYNELVKAEKDGTIARLNALYFGA
jgi:hypothetical protein